MTGKKRGRNVEELYNVTEKIGETKITSASERSHRMQGPLDETSLDNEKYMESSQAEKRLGKRFMRRKALTRAESGTCNVCSAPCSSCMHLKLACMGSKGDEFSDETCHVTASSQDSINESGELLTKNKARDGFQHATSEASNLISVNSSHDSLSENAESKAKMRSTDGVDALTESEALLKLSSGGAVTADQFSPKPDCLSDHKAFLIKQEDFKTEEGHDDNMSCVSRDSDLGKALSYCNKNLDRKNLSFSSALDSTLGVEGSHKSDLLVTPSNVANAGSSSPKVQTKCLSLNTNGNHLEEDPSYHGRGKLLEDQTEHINHSLSTGATFNTDCGGKSDGYDIADDCANGKSILEGDTSKVSSKFHPKLESEADKDSGDQTNEGFKRSYHVEQDYKSNESVELADTQEPPLQSASGDESDESEILEHDVKVCDICGDAGREDLLAICSRCSDGAEHTYCMREMLQKLPEGDWLCEECKLAEETEHLKHDADEKRMSKANTQGLGKRHAETVEMASALKRQAVETSLASPKSSSPSRITSLSRDSSFKSLDKGKVKIAHQTSFGNRLSVDIPEVARPSSNGPRLQTPKGTLLKSNSFNTLNSKPKVKLTDEVPQKPKGAREGSSLDTKELLPARMMSKSMSFKSVNSGRSSTNDSKVKMLSSNFSYVQDSRGLKQVKDRNAFDRKKLSKLDRLPASSMMSGTVVSTPKVEQRLTPRGDSASVSSTSNSSRELKIAQSDGKLATLSRSTSSVGRKGAEIPVPSVRASSTNGMTSTSVEQKLNQISPKDEPSSSSSGNAERASNIANENFQDGLSRSRESSNQGDKTMESSFSRLRPAGIAVSKNVTCQKCKEIGHVAENCTVVSPRSSGADVSTPRSAREEMSKGSNLKAAIEAAMLKKPGIYRKKKESDQSDGLSSSNVDASGEITSLGQLLAVNKMNEGAHEGQANLSACSSDSYKHTDINDLKQLNERSTDAVIPFKALGSDSNVPYLGKPGLASLAKSVVTKTSAIPPGLASVAKSVLTKISAIPEHEYIWQGAFEVRRGGKLADIYSGIQAHLSTCASPKVLDMVNKFPQKITLDEAPRLSTWPRQFHINGAKEENIALYFFAKDFESYEIYKGLLDNMIKKDLALKGSFDGVEFFVFPSTQLPENSQRWNMLFFLWGVFRGRRSDCSDSLKKPVIPSLNMVPLDKEIPTAVMSSSENVCVSERIDKEASACDSSCGVPVASNALNKPYVSLGGDPDNKVINSQTRSEKQDSTLDAKTLSNIPRSSAPLDLEIRGSSPSLEAVGTTECRLDVELKTVTGTKRGSNIWEDKQMHGAGPHTGEDVSSFKIFRVGSQDSSGKRTFSEEKIMDRTYHDGNDVKVERDIDGENVNMEVEASSKKGLRKRSYLDLSETAQQTTNSIIQKAPWNKADNKLVDEDGSSKKLKTGFSVLYGGSGSRDGNSLSCSLASQALDLGSSSSIEEKSFDKASGEKVIVEDLGTSERYFFPVDSHHVQDSRLPGNSLPWNSSNEEDRVLDGVPNLELALGAETKSPNRGILPFFAGMVDKNNNQNKPPDKMMNKEEDDGVSASLSLSLSFPFPEKEKTLKPVSKPEQLVPERRHVNTSLLLFGGFSDK